MNNKFFLNSIGLAAIILALAFLIRSVQTANAAPPKPNDYFVEGTNDCGKYHIQYSEGETSAGAMYYHALVYDSQTGKNAIYAWDNTKLVWYEFFAGKEQVPNIIK